MVVQPDRKAARRAVQPARHDGGDLALEVDQRLEDALAPAEPVPGGLQAVAGRDPGLALAVIALGAGLQDAGQARRGGEVGLAADRLVVGGADAGLAEERLLAQPVLGEDGSPVAGPHRPVPLAFGDGLLRHVLEFVGDDIDLGGEAGEGGLVVVLALDLPGGDLAARSDRPPASR